MTHNDSGTQPRFLTQDQLCARWSINRSTLWRFRKAGLPTLKTPGRLVRFDAEAVDQWFLEYAGVAS